MYKRIDFIFLRRSLIIFAVLIASSLIFYVGGERFKETSKLDFDSSKNALNSSHSKLRKKSNEISLIDQYLTKYKALSNNGYIGEERRLSWIESLKETNKTIKLPEFSYSIRPQEDYSRPGIKPSKTVISLSSVMNLKLGLLHEEDLFDVLALIDENVQSKFVIDACSLNAKRNVALKVNEVNISANCDLRWVNLKVVAKK